MLCLVTKNASNWLWPPPTSCFYPLPHALKILVHITSLGIKTEWFPFQKVIEIKWNSFYIIQIYIYIYAHTWKYIFFHIFWRKLESSKYINLVVWFHWKKIKRRLKANCSNSRDSWRLGPGHRYTTCFSWDFRHTSSTIRFVNLRGRVFFPKDME